MSKCVVCGAGELIYLANARPRRRVRPGGQGGRVMGCQEAIRAERRCPL